MDVKERLQAFRGEMRKKNLSAYIVPTEDFHCSEYVGDYFKAREYLSGFTGSAGTLLVMRERALLWTDGRYFLQAEEQAAGGSHAFGVSGRTSRKGSGSRVRRADCDGRVREGT